MTLASLDLDSYGKSSFPHPDSKQSFNSVLLNDIFGLEENIVFIKKIGREIFIYGQYYISIYNHRKNIKTKDNEKPKHFIIATNLNEMAVMIIFLDYGGQHNFWCQETKHVFLANLIVLISKRILVFHD